MGIIFDFIWWLCVDLLNSKLVYHVAVASVFTYIASKFLLNNLAARERLRVVFDGKNGLYNRYYAMLSYGLENSRPVFYSGSLAAPLLRPILSIYTTFLALALGYTVVLFFLGWATGGSGSIGSFPIIGRDTTITDARAFIAGGWLVLGFFVAQSVRHHDAIMDFLKTAAEKFLGGLSIRVFLALLAAAAVFGSQWLSQQRTFGLSQPIIYAVQTLLAILAGVVIYRSKRPLSSFSFVLTSCYGLAVGVPILIGIPLAIALITPRVGKVPLFVSSIIVPTLTIGYYYFAPRELQGQEVGSAILSAIVCVPMAVAVFSAAREMTTKLGAFFFALGAFLPFWIPVSFSPAQISDPVAFAVVVFWLVFPAMNAIWDSLSWFCTWTLLNRLRVSLDASNKLDGSGLEKISGAVETIKRLSVVTLHVVMNLCLSAAIFSFTFVALVWAMEMVNFIIKPVHPEYQFDVSKLLTSVRQNTASGDGLWMVTSALVTLIPAIVHLVVVIVSFLMIAVGPKNAQDKFEQLIKPKVEERIAKVAINTLSLYLALSVCVASLLILNAWNIYLRYGASHGVQGALEWLGKIGQTLAGR